MILEIVYVLIWTQNREISICLEFYSLISFEIKHVDKEIEQEHIIIHYLLIKLN